MKVASLVSIYIYMNLISYAIGTVCIAVQIM